MYNFWKFLQNGKFQDYRLVVDDRCDKKIKKLIDNSELQKKLKKFLILLCVTIRQQNVENLYVNMSYKYDKKISATKIINSLLL